MPVRNGSEMEKRADGADASVLIFSLCCANFLAVNGKIAKTFDFSTVLFFAENLRLCYFYTLFHLWLIIAEKEGFLEMEENGGSASFCLYVSACKCQTDTNFLCKCQTNTTFSLQMLLDNKMK